MTHVSSKGDEFPRSENVDDFSRELQDHEKFSVSARVFQK